MNKNRRAWLGTFGANLIILLCATGTSILSARLLQPEGRGLLAVIFFWPSVIAGVGFLSVHEATTYHVSRPESDVNTVRATAFWVAVVFSGIIGLILYLMLPSLLGARRMDVLRTAQVYSIVFLPSTLVALALLAVDQGRMNFARFNLLRSLNPALYLVGILFLWFTENVTVSSMAFAALFGVVISALLRFALSAGEVLRVPPSLATGREIVTTGIHYHLANLAIFAGTEVDKFMVLLLLDNRDLGFYVSGAAVAATGLNAISQPFRHILFPTISQTVMLEDRQQILARHLRFAGFLLVSLQGLLACLSPWLVPLLFGQPFSAAIPITIVLVCTFAVRGLRNVMVYGLRAMGETRIGTLSETLILAVFVLLSFPFSKVAGLLGIGCALLLSDIVSVIFLAGYLRKEHRLRFRDWWGFDVATAKQAFSLVFKRVQ